MLLFTSQSLHYSQKMLVMSESRLKIQITSGADIRTKDQDTPLTDWRNVFPMALRKPTRGPCGASSSSSGSFSKQNQGGHVLSRKESVLTGSQSPHLHLASWLDVGASNEFEDFVHHDDRNGQLEYHYPLGPGQGADLEYHLSTSVSSVTMMLKLVSVLMHFQPSFTL